MKKSLKKISTISVCAICCLLLSAMILNYFYPFEYISRVAHEVRVHSRFRSVAEIPYVKQWTSLYLYSQPNVALDSYYSGPKFVEFEKILYKRYYLFMTIHCTTNFAGTKIASYEEPVLEVKTIKSVTNMGEINSYHPIPNAYYRSFGKTTYRFD